VNVCTPTRTPAYPRRWAGTCARHGGTECLRLRRVKVVQIRQGRQLQIDGVEGFCKCATPGADGLAASNSVCGPDCRLGNRGSDVVDSPATASRACRHRPRASMAPQKGVAVCKRAAAGRACSPVATVQTARSARCRAHSSARRASRRTGAGHLLRVSRDSQHCLARREVTWGVESMSAGTWRAVQREAAQRLRRPAVIQRVGVHGGRRRAAGVCAQRRRRATARGPARPLPRPSRPGLRGKSRV